MGEEGRGVISLAGQGESNNNTSDVKAVGQPEGDGKAMSTKKRKLGVSKTYSF